MLTNTSDSHFVSTTPRAMGLYLNVEAPEFLDGLERLEAKNEGLAPFQYEAVDYVAPLDTAKWNVRRTRAAPVGMGAK